MLQRVDEAWWEADAARRAFRTAERLRYHAKRAEAKAAKEARAKRVAALPRRARLKLEREKARLAKADLKEREAATKAVLGERDNFGRWSKNLPPFEAELLNEPIHERSAPYVRDPDPYASDTRADLRAPAVPSGALGGELEGLDELEELWDLASLPPPWVLNVKQKPKPSAEED